MKDNKKEETLTPAQQIFSGKELIVSRPEGMAYHEYWILRKIQSQVLKQLFRKAPSRKLSGVITPHKPILQGFRRAVKQRKAT
jgi:hypothetical protein